MVTQAMALLANKVCDQNNSNSLSIPSPTNLTATNLTATNRLPPT
jgi:hypothetical protein